MAELIQDQIKGALEVADGLYHRLVLLVAESGSGKTGVLQEVADAFGTQVINVNRALSYEMLELTARQRSLRLPSILKQLAAQTEPPVVLDNLEILFDKTLKRDPLSLLRNISRNRGVVASWSGRFSGGRLLYAEREHPEYQEYDSVDVLIVRMDGTTTVNGEPIDRIANPLY